MNSTSLPAASSPRAADDAEVGSLKGPGQEEEEVPEVPQGNLPDFGHEGDQPPKGSEFGPGPDSAPEPLVAPEFGGRPLHKKAETATPVTFVQTEAPDNLLEALNGASIDEEHRTVMSAVIQKVQSAKSVQTEALLEICPRGNNKLVIITIFPCS